MESKPDGRRKSRGPESHGESRTFFRMTRDTTACTVEGRPTGEKPAVPPVASSVVLWRRR
jgi:hypothetical protein